MTPEVLDTLHRELPDHEVVEFDPAADLASLLAEDAEVIVAGGDGTVGHVVRALAGSPRRLGVLGLGTYNNFARSLGMPEDLSLAIRAIREGRPAPITVGRANGQPF